MALTTTLQVIAMRTPERTPDCLREGTMLRELAHLTMVAYPESMDSTPSAPRAKMLAAIAIPPAMRLPPPRANHTLPVLGTHTCPPDRPIWTA